MDDKTTANNIDSMVTRECEKCKKSFDVNLSDEKKLGYKITWCSDKCKEKFSGEAL